MSLINCLECNNKVSDKAYICPCCGYPFVDNVKERNNEVQSKLPDEMITIKDVAKHLGISHATAYKLVSYKGFPKMYIGKRCVIKKDRYLKWLEDNYKSRIIL